MNMPQAPGPDQPIDLGPIKTALAQATGEYDPRLRDERYLAFDQLRSNAKAWIGALVAEVEEFRSSKEKETATSIVGLDTSRRLDAIRSLDNQPKPRGASEDAKDEKSPPPAPGGGTVEPGILGQNEQGKPRFDVRRADDGYELIDLLTNELICNDWGEPEDKMLVRDFAPMVEKLNELAAEVEASRARDNQPIDWSQHYDRLWGEIQCVLYSDGNSGIIKCKLHRALVDASIRARNAILASSDQGKEKPE